MLLLILFVEQETRMNTFAKPAPRMARLCLPALISLLASLSMSPLSAQNRIDTIRADAPALAAYGSFVVGVRTLKLSNPQQIDLLQIDPNAPKPDALPRYERPITLELWYPAQAGAAGNTTLRALVRDGKTAVSLQGRAVRDAAVASPDAAGKAKAGFPLVIVSHGFPGNRFLLAPLAENMASKGYVVASIDHTDSTYDALGPRGFASTLVNRPLDQLFVLNALSKLAQDGASFLHGKVDANRTAVVGYSTGP
jgi:Platelet-activating factor acetylhydrolase, isoform II